MVVRPDREVDPFRYYFSNLLGRHIQLSSFRLCSLGGETMTKGEQACLPAWRSRVLQAAAGEPVARVCRRFGISRKSFYKWKRRHAEQGDAGLGDRPGPHTVRPERQHGRS